MVGQVVSVQDCKSNKESSSARQNISEKDWKNVKETGFELCCKRRLK